MKSQKFKIPVFGVGPIFVITCLILTIVVLCKRKDTVLYGEEIKKSIYRKTIKT